MRNNNHGKSTAWILAMLILNVLCAMHIQAAYGPGMLCYAERERHVCLPEAICDLWDVWTACVFNDALYISRYGDDATCGPTGRSRSDTSWRKPCTTMNGMLNRPSGLTAEQPSGLTAERFF